MKKETKARLDIILSTMERLPTAEFDFFMENQWLPFLNSLDKTEQEEAMAIFLKTQLDTLKNLAAYLPKMGDKTFEAIQTPLNKLSSLAAENEVHLAAA